jgi:hypothetical protein
MAGPLLQVVNGYIITSIPDTTEEATMLESLVESNETGHENKIIMSAYSLCKKERKEGTRTRRIWKLKNEIP